MSHIVRLMIEKETHLNVEMVENLGYSTVQHQAMDRNGDVDITPHTLYRDGLTASIGDGAGKDPEKALERVQKEFCRNALTKLGLIPMALLTLMLVRSPGKRARKEQMKSRRI